uniref:DUF4939 domain-containing protein n=1 Tax=Xiphophorus maculatus TaxID=8083 RepID=A0A3B5QBI2_XIPMA
MTEHSGHTNPADALRQTIAEQHSLIQSHEVVLRALSERQEETNQRLDQLASLLRDLQPTHPIHDVRAPTPEKFSGEQGGCGGFLLQCSLSFNRSPLAYPHDEAKISFVLGLLTGKALRWPNAVVHKPSLYAVVDLSVGWEASCSTNISLEEESTDDFYSTDSVL